MSSESNPSRNEAMNAALARWQEAVGIPSTDDPPDESGALSKSDIGNQNTPTPDSNEEMNAAFARFDQSFASSTETEESVDNTPGGNETHVTPGARTPDVDPPAHPQDPDPSDPSAPPAEARTAGAVGDVNSDLPEHPQDLDLDDPNPAADERVQGGNQEAAPEEPTVDEPETEAILQQSRAERDQAFDERLQAASADTQGRFSRFMRRAGRALGVTPLVQHAQVWAMNNAVGAREARELRLRYQYDELDRALASLERQRDAFLQRTERLQQLRPNAHSAMAADTSKFDQAIERHRHKINRIAGKLEEAQGKTRDFVNERNTVIDKITDRISEKLDPYEANIRSAESRLTEHAEFETGVDIELAQAATALDTLTRERVALHEAYSNLNQAESNIAIFELRSLDDQIRQRKNDIATKRMLCTNDRAKLEAELAQHKRKSRSMRATTDRLVTLKQRVLDTRVRPRGERTAPTATLEQTRPSRNGAEAAPEQDPATPNADRYSRDWNMFVARNRLRINGQPIPDVTGDALIEGLRRRGFVTITRTTKLTEQHFTNLLIQWYRRQGIVLPNAETLVQQFFTERADLERQQAQAAQQARTPNDNQPRRRREQRRRGGQAQQANN